MLDERRVVAEYKKLLIGQFINKILLWYNHTYFLREPQGFMNYKIF